jgi:hypothetical protein
VGADAELEKDKSSGRGLAWQEDHLERLQQRGALLGAQEVDVNEKWPLGAIEERVKKVLRGMAVQV